mmetsp:Transcript_22476/g.36075  ORF Transcript_22476/g.36075 Transcript_22476/m.36075 type:complete len:221 (+) Transcript_22476:116-778(+)
MCPGITTALPSARTLSSVVSAILCWILPTFASTTSASTFSVSGLLRNSTCAICGAVNQRKQCCQTFLGCIMLGILFLTTLRTCMCHHSDSILGNNPHLTPKITACQVFSLLLEANKRPLLLSCSQELADGILKAGDLGHWFGRNLSGSNSCLHSLPLTNICSSWVVGGFALSSPANACTLRQLQKPLGDWIFRLIKEFHQGICNTCISYFGVSTGHVEGS